MTKALSALAALALLGGALFFFFNRQTPSPAPASQVQTETAEKTEAKLELANGVVLAFDPGVPETLDQALGMVTPEQKAVLKKLFQSQDGQLVPRDPKSVLTAEEQKVIEPLRPIKISIERNRGDGGGGPFDDKRAQFDREAQTSLAALRDMIKSGADREQSKAQVEAALTDSYRKLIGGNAEVKVNLDVDPETGRESIGIGIMQTRP